MRRTRCGSVWGVRVTLICNTRSGRGVDPDATAEALRRRGVEVPEVAESPGEARAAGVDRIVVVGGGGPLGPAAALAAERRLPLAVIPAGTANDFARSLGLPSD